jgi:hypothetical protein
VLAVVALTIALVLPRPAQRTLEKEEDNRLRVACGVVGILLADDARNRVELAGSFARRDEIVKELSDASNATAIDEKTMKQTRAVGEQVMKTIQGARRPSFAMLIDKKGRVAARIGADENDGSETVAGRPLIDDALAGYMRDDIWVMSGSMYLVSASPVVKREPPVEYVGAVVLGHQVTADLAKKLVSSLDVQIGFYLGDNPVAGSDQTALDQQKMVGAVTALTNDDITKDCPSNQPLALNAGNEEYNAIVARLPGEAAAKKAFYSVFIKPPAELGFFGTLKIVTKDDLGGGNFPWFLVAGLLVVMLGGGIGLMWIESDRPLRRLAADTVKLAKGEKERLAEDAHPGKYGSIARSVNLHIDKLGRDAKAAKKDLDQLLGPAPEGSLGTIDLLATALPSVRPGGPAPAVAPPPSEFRFSDSSGSGGMAARPSPPAMRAPTPPPIRQSAPYMAAQTPPPAATFHTPPPAPMSPSASQPPMRLEDDILGGGAPPMGVAPASSGAANAYFKQVFDQFIAVKKSCNEPTSGLTYEKFTEKLMKNRDDLIAKTGCREVRFTVYVKDGKAALKATPVKDEQ